MDIPRARGRIAPRTAKLATGVATLAIACASATYAMALLLHPAPSLPSVARSEIVVDRARIAPIVRAVRASGTLVANRIFVVATSDDGIVANVAVQPGAHVTAGSLVASLRNPDLDAAVVDARAQVDVARAQLRSAIEESRGERLDAQGAYRSALAEMQRSHEEERTDAALVDSGLIATLPYRQAQIKADETRDLLAIASRKQSALAAAEAAKIAIAQAALDHANAALTANLARVATLQITAGSDGVVQSVTAEGGARVAAGTELARIASERDLKAVLQVAEGDTNGIEPGMRVTLETNGAGRIVGHVARIAPSAVAGSVAVDVTLEPTNAQVRPALDVDGTIELYRSPDALTIARPPGAADGSTVSLYRLTPDGSRAERTRVSFGAGSLDRVEVRSGLAAGASVVVSDTSGFADAPIVRIAPL